MNKSTLLQQILSVVSEICEISEEEILSHTKRADVVDARTIFVFCCHRYGFPSADIVKFIHRAKVSTVTDYLYNHKVFSQKSASFRYLSHEVSKKLSTILPA